MKQKTILAGVLVLAMTAPTGHPGADAATNRILTVPSCGTTGVASGIGPFTCTYTTVGSDTFTVPTGVSQAAVTVVGAQGGHYFIAGDMAHGGSPGGDLTGRPGGNGGEVAGTLMGLTEGQIIQIDVAGIGGNGTAASRSGGMMNGPSGGSGASGGFGGSNGGVRGGPGDAAGANGGTAFNGGNGSGGGGSSDVRVDPGGCAALTCPLSDRALVGAGGAGGGGTGGQGNALGGAGGDGGGVPAVPVDQGLTATPPTDGGAGGATVDGGNAGVAGTGGTSSAGGTPGTNSCRHGGGSPPPANPLTDPRCGGDGVNGAAGLGGAGGAGNLPCSPAPTDGCGTASTTTSGGGAGGGAGGGYFGGGGGSGGGGTFGGGGGAGGGGGGGSSFAAATVGSPVLTSGINSPTNPINGGNGQIVITWMPVPPTTTMLDVSPASPAASGTVETLTATVSPSAAGSVQFRDGTSPIGTPVTVADGSASMTTTLAPGTHSLTAVFTPADPTAFGGSTSSAMTYTVNGVVNQTPTRTTLTASPPSPVASGTLETLTASVSPVTVPGTVQFLDGATPVGDPVEVSAGAAETHTTLGSGTHSLTAVFTPTDSSAFAPSTSAATSYTVNPLPGQSSRPQPGSPSEAGHRHHGHAGDHAPSGCPSGGCADIAD